MDKFRLHDFEQNSPGPKICMILLLQNLKTVKKQPSVIPEVRIVIVTVKAWVLVSDDTPGEDFWVYVSFLELGGGYMGTFIL